MISDITYYSVRELCDKHCLTQEDITEIFLSEDVPLCIYLTNLKTYYFDLILINGKVTKYEVNTCFISGLFYLTPYETCKVLRCGEAMISHVKPKGETFITLAHPRRITFSDLLVETSQLNTFDAVCYGYAAQRQSRMTI